MSWLKRVLLALCLTGCGAGASVPARAVELNHLGAVAITEGDLETAGARLSLALEYNPDFEEALTNLGLVELARGNFDRAEQLLLRSRRLNPDVAQTHHGLGVVAEHRLRPDIASDHYREALAVDPGFADARANLARLLFQAGHYEHALIEFRLLVEAAPERIEGRTGLGLTLVALHRLDEASAEASAIRSSFGETAQGRLLEGRILVKARHFEAALRHLAPLAEVRDMHTATALAWMSVCELSLGRPERALLAAEEALRLEPDDALATYALAVALDDIDDPSARAWLVRAVSMNPQNPALELRLRHRE